MLQVKQVTIIGTGLLGASLALALKQQGFGGQIVGVGRRQETLDQARGLGCFDGLTTSTAEALEAGRGLPGEAPHMAVLAAPLGHFREILEKVALADDPGLIITDVGSTKATVCALARELLPDASRFVGSHPMAGSEQQGPMAADAGLFEGKPCVVTRGKPGSMADDRTVALVRCLWELVGMRLYEMTPERHDRSVALVSHLPHAVAALLVKIAMADGGDALDIASTGFADTTRIAAGDPGLWVDIFQNNQAAVIESLECAVTEIERFRKALARGDHGALRRLLVGAKEARDSWEQDRSGTK